MPEIRLHITGMFRASLLVAICAVAHCFAAPLLHGAPLRTISTATQFSTAEESTLSFEGAEWSRKDGNIKGDGVVTQDGPTGFYYRRDLAGQIDLKWYAPAADGKTDDSPAIQRAIDATVAAGVRLFIPPGIYRIGKPLVKPQSFTGLEMVATPGSVTFEYPDLPDGSACLKIIGGSGNLCKAVVEGISFEGNPHSTAIEIAGQCGQMIRKCTFGQNAVGLCLHNEVDGQFSEWDTAEECEWKDACVTAVEYKRTKGNLSFHGSGLVKMNWINTKTGGGGPVILVQDGCLPYNAPLNVQVWHTGDKTLIENRNGPPSNFSPCFYGALTSESFKGALTLGKSGRILFSGPIQAFGGHTEAGTLLTCEKIAYPDGGAIPMGVKWSCIRKLVPGQNTIETFARDSTYWVAVNLQAPNYDFRYLLLITTDGFGQPGTVAKSISLKAFDGAGYGTPTFSCDEQGQLKITNPKFPESGIKAILSYKQAADWIEGNYPDTLF